MQSIAKCYWHSMTQFKTHTKCKQQHQQVREDRQGDSETCHSQQAACYLCSFSHSLSPFCLSSLSTTVIPLTNQQPHSAYLQAIWAWFPWGAHRLQLVPVLALLPTIWICLHCLCGPPQDLEVIEECNCLPVKRVHGTVPAPFVIPLIEICKSNMRLSTRIPSSPKQYLQKICSGAAP